MSYKLSSEITLDGFIDFLVARQDLYVTGNSSDPAFKFKINNIYREQDRYSTFEIKNLNAIPDRRDKIFFTLTGRFLLHEIGLRYLLKAATYTEWSKSVDELEGRNSSAFFNPCIQTAPQFGMSIKEMCWGHRWLCEEVADKLDTLVGNESLEYLHKFIYDSPLFLGPFRAYEVCTSLTYFIDEYTEDDMFHIGGGSTEVFLQLFNIPLTKISAYEKKIRVMAAKNMVKDKLIEQGFKFSTILEKKYGPQKYTLRNLEDSMCEYRKYLNAVAGKGEKYVENKRG